MTNQSQAQQTVVVPKAIHPHAGGLSLTLSPTVIGGNLEGVFRYGRDYPYTCWEQKLTKAVLASQFKTLTAYVAPHLQWPDSDALPEKTLQEAVNFQANNGGMAYFTATDSHTDPYLSAYTALQFNWLKQQGYAVPETVSKNLTTYVQTFLRKDQSRDFYTQSMTATVRAVALAALAPAISATDLDRLRDYLPNISLFGLAHYLQAAIQVGRGAKATKVGDTRLAAFVRLYRARALLAHAPPLAARAIIEAEAAASDAIAANLPAVRVTALTLGAAAHLAASEATAALTSSTTAMALLTELGSLEEDEAEVYVIHARVLSASVRDDEAAVVRQRGRERIQQLADFITGEQLRARFLSDVPAHRELA